MTASFRLLVPVVLFSVAVILGGCVERPPATPSGAGYKIGKPYKINGVWYYPHVDYEYSETGIASWYGPGFHGKRTASGEVYNQNDLTAAHRTLPMPSLVRVTNLENGRQLTLRVNDRGPFAHGRIIDISRRGAQLLDFQQNGTARVRVEIMADESRQMALAAGAYSAADAAGGQGGSSGIVSADGQAAAAPAGKVTEEKLAPLPGVKSAPASTTIAAASAKANPSTAGKTIAAPVKPDGKVTKVPVRATGVYVQAGAFTNQANANRLRSRLAKLGPTRIDPVFVDNQRFYRVRVGPIASVAEADRILSQVIGAGQTQARIIVE
jgi:rare lipoprotein A